MMVLHQRFQAFVQNMSINLRGRDVGMTQELLKRAQVCAMGEQVRRERMTQHVGRDFGRIDVRFDRKLF